LIYYVNMDKTGKGRLIRAVVLGAGYRGCAYAAYAAAHPDQLQIVGVADPVRAQAIPAPRYWDDWRACLSERPEADVVMIALPESMHCEAAMAALDGGYHVLLETPIATTEAECGAVVAKAVALKRLVMSGCVLRHARYFAHIKVLLDSGELGRVVSIAHQHSVGHDRSANPLKPNSAKIRAMGVHDFDLLSWWVGEPCERVTSFGPKAGAGGGEHAFPDHMCANMEFRGGATATLMVTGYGMRSCRTTRISCTKGEIVGNGEMLDVCRFDRCDVETGMPPHVAVDNPSDNGGGDFNLVSELVRLLRDGDEDGLRRVSERSLESHRMAFAAIRSRLNDGRVVEMHAEI